MAVIFMDGFDHYVDGSDLPNKWVYSGTPSFNTNYRRFDTGEGLQISSYSTFLYRDIDNKTTLVVGFAAKLSNTSASYGAGYPFLYLYDTDGGDYQLCFYFDSLAIKVYRDSGGTLLGTSSDAFDIADQWKFLEFKTVIDDTVGSVEIRSNEETILNLTNQDTKNTANAYVNRVGIKGVYVATIIDYDDLYVDDSDFLGDVRVYNFNPDDDGTYSQFTPSAGSNYQCVDEGQPNDDTDYVSSNVSGNKDTYTFTTGSLKTVKAVQLTNYVRKDDAGQRKIRNLCRSNGSDYRSDKRDLDAAYKAESYLWETDPDDSNVWTQTKIEAAEFGLEIATTTTTTSSTTTTTTTP